MDVNGLAGSIELYMGTDVLKDNSGDLRPVQWGGYNSFLDSYQGSILGKTDIQNAYFRKCAAALEDPSIMTAQDWSGMSILVDGILGSLSCQLPAITKKRIVAGETQ